MISTKWGSRARPAQKVDFGIWIFPEGVITFRLIYKYPQTTQEDVDKIIDAWLRG